MYNIAVKACSKNILNFCFFINELYVLILSFIFVEADNGERNQSQDVGNSIESERSCSSLNNSIYEGSSTDDEVFYDARSHPQTSESEMETDSEFEMFEEPQKDPGVYLEG